MAGYSDYPMRQIVRSLGGCGLFYTELISCHSVIHAQDKVRALLKSDESEYPLTVQLFGSHLEYMPAAASQLEALGAGMIDINMGCPVSKVVKTGGGAVLMKEPETAAAVVRAVKKAVSVPLTVKIRLGWDSASVNAPEFAALMVRSGAQAVAVHGRTRAQLYSGKADWAGIARVVEAVKKEDPAVPVIANGDIVSPESAASVIEETGCDGIMIGRAALGAPWLFKRVEHYLRTGEMIPEPGMAERGGLALKHLGFLKETYGEKLASLHIRRIACGYARGFQGVAEFRRRIVKAASTKEAAEIIEEFFIKGSLEA
jgi:nifR3 family TIM-barrel protein